MSNFLPSTISSKVDGQEVSKQFKEGGKIHEPKSTTTTTTTTVPKPHKF